MSRDYFNAYHSYLKSMRNLSDAECGRLFRALLQYSAGDKLIKLQGRERIAFDFIAEQIDHDEAAYNAKCETNRKNRSLASGDDRGRPSTNDDDRQRTMTNDNDRQRTTTTVDDRGRPFSEREKEREKETEKETEKKKSFPPYPLSKEKEGEKEKEKKREKERESSAVGRFFPDSENLERAFADWIEYKHEKRQDYKPKGLEALVTKLKKAAAEYGETAVIGLIEESMANNWQGIIFDRIALHAAKEVSSVGKSQGDTWWDVRANDRWKIPVNTLD